MTTRRFNGRAGAIAAATFAVLLLLFLFARGPLRGWFGDVVVVLFLVAAAATVGLGTARSRLLGVGLTFVSVELLQTLELVGPGSHWFLHMTLGSTADPLDVFAYLVGLGCAAGAERWYTEPRQPNSES